MPSPRVARAPSHLDVQLLNGDEGTAWANLGDWSDATTYPAAARALAVRVGTAAGLAPGHRIFDAGSGAGEQLLLWPTVFGVARVTACDRSDVFAAAATRLVQRAGLAERVAVIAAEATKVPLEQASLDRVIALDSAYHFGARDDFFRHAVAALKPGGRLALTDLMLGEGARRWTPHWGRIADIDPTALLTSDSYQAMLRHAGFTDVRLVDLSTPVLSGFARWARAQRVRLMRHAPRGGWAAVALTGMLAGHLHRTQQLSYVLITATKPAP